MYPSFPGALALSSVALYGRRNLQRRLGLVIPFLLFFIPYGNTVYFGTLTLTRLPCRLTLKKILLLPALTYAWDPSGMKLSEKLHSDSVEMRRKIINTIETQQKLNKGAIEVARELYDGYNSGKRVIYTQRLPQYLDKIYAYARRSDLSTREQEKCFASSEKRKNRPRKWDKRSTEPSIQNGDRREKLL